MPGTLLSPNRKGDKWPFIYPLTPPGVFSTSLSFTNFGKENISSRSLEVLSGFHRLIWIKTKISHQIHDAPQLLQKQRLWSPHLNPSFYRLGIKDTVWVCHVSNPQQDLVRRFQTHLPVEASSHGDNVPRLTVDSEHVLGGALWGLGDDPVPHHPVGRGAVVRVVRRHRHHVGPWEQARGIISAASLQSRLGSLWPGVMHFVQKCYGIDIPLQSSQPGKARIMEIATLLRLMIWKDADYT